MSYSSIKIANAMIDEARSDGRVLTPLQLIKLVYITHGWSFVFLDEPLLSEPVQAWQYGPVSPSLYYAVRGYRASPIEGLIQGDTDPQELSSRAIELIHVVYERYKHLSGTQLSGLTHMPETPWSITWESKGKNALISNDLIAEHYKKRFASMSELRCMVERIWFPLQKPPEIPEDAKSLGEAMGMASGVDLSSREQLNRINRLVREDGMDTHVNRVVVCGLWIVAGAAVVMFLVLVAHKVRPGLWLSDSQLDGLQSFLFSGGLGAGLAGFGKKILRPESKGADSI